MFRCMAAGLPGPELLDCGAMRRSDAFAVDQGVPSAALMERAGQAVADAIAARWAPRPAAILCGPGNNGGDGYVVARLLAEQGWPVEVFLASDREKLAGDARRASDSWHGRARPLTAFDPADFSLVVDALFGAGLSRLLDGAALHAVETANCADLIRVAVDVPSGVSGDSAAVEGAAFNADLTVSFHRLKPAHLFAPAREHCGELACSDIGIPPGWQEAAGPVARLSSLSDIAMPVMAHRASQHKHQRGRLCVLAGGPGATSAARLSAEAGLAMGAGLVTLLCPPASLIESTQVSAPVMTRPVREADFADTLAAHRASALVMGPGAGADQRLKERVLAALRAGTPLVLDADALTVFEDAPAALFAALHPGAVLTPHAGEFERLFPGVLNESATPLEAAQQASARAGAVIVLKGPATVIAPPSGAAHINACASARLATAGSGDVLAGMIGGLMAQGIAPFAAAVSAVWLHGQAGFLLPPGGNAGDLVRCIPAVLSAALDEQSRQRALARLSL